ncbi:MAG TPA: PAS domain S-box protein [Gemmatimonadaceae bacterium]|nr:PAS domain S-box protein [Gemmatimonadaceae bacterium]
MQSQEIAELHSLLIDSVRDYAIFALDPTGHVLSWNAGARRFKGYEAHEIIGKHFSVFYPRELVDEGFPDYELKVAAETGRFEDEGWRIRKDGTRFWANVVITALRDKKGELRGFGKVTRDLTARREAEEALRESEERFRLLVDGVRDYAIFLMDPKGNVMTWNPGAERIKGYHADEIIGRSFKQFYTPDDIASRHPDKELETAARTGKFEEEGWRVRKDGSTFWASVLISALRNKSGELVGFAKVTRDLTERRQAQEREMRAAQRLALEEAARREAEVREEEVRAMADQLERHSDELEKRTREAEQARQRADEANKVKGQFLAAMSHELRTPLNAIGGYADLLLLEVAGTINEKQRDHLERVKRSQAHLLAIINDILGFTRIEAGQLTYDFDNISLDEAAQSAMQLLAGQAQTKRVALNFVPVDGPVTAWADRAKVEQIVLNLVSNALKFTDTGEITVSTRVSGDRAMISVRDTGFGIPADKLESVFEPFVQVGRSLTKNKEGTGLGLAISRDLARAMKGDLTAQSEVDVGSEFTVSLPLSANSA